MSRRRFMAQSAKSYTDYFFVSSDNLFYSPADVAKMTAAEKAKIKGYALGRLNYPASSTNPVYNRNNSGAGRIMALNTITGLSWGWKGTDVPDLYNYSGANLQSMDDYDGKTNTDYIASQGVAKGCKSYNPGYKSGEWYLPAGGEMAMFLNNKNRIQSDFNLAGVSHTILFTSGSVYVDYWTSTEQNSANAYYLNLFYNNFNGGDKDYNATGDFRFYAIPFLLYK